MYKISQDKIVEALLKEIENMKSLK